MNPWIVTFLFVLAAPLSSTAIARDLCKDVLVDGTKASSSWRNNVFLWQSLATKTFQSVNRSSDTTKSGGLNFNVGEMVFAGKYDERDVQRFAQVNKTSMQFESMLQDQSSVLLASGDKDILRAWSECMGKAYGLSVTFEVLTPRMARLHLDWYPYPTIPGGTRDTRVTADSVPVQRSGVTVLDADGCLKSGRVLEAGKRCTATVEFDSGSRDLSVTLKTLHGDESAYLPPRMKLVPDRKPWMPTKAEGGFGHAYGERWANTSPRTCVRAPEGFDIVHAATRVRTVSGGKVAPGDTKRCYATLEILAAQAACFTVTVLPPEQGDNWCDGYLEGEVIKWNLVEGSN